MWNDVWMGRDDLAAEGSYGGWQAIDATPQEESSGVYRCGPAPLNALKQGRVDLDFDGKFIYAEVNASKKHWVRNKDAGRWDSVINLNLHKFTFSFISNPASISEVFLGQKRSF